MGRTGSSRSQNAAVLNEAYGARSEVAHGGTIGPVKVSGREGRTPGSDFFREAASLAQQLIQIVIKLGGILDWERLVLSGE